MSAERSSLPPAYFESLYAGDPDPWRFASSPYEREKYRRTLAALPRARYRRGFEVGCSIGVLTAEVAAHSPGGDVILVHWTGPTDYPLSADRAVELFSSATHGFMRLLRQERQPRYRLDVLRRSRGSARRGRASSTPS